MKKTIPAFHLFLLMCLTLPFTVTGQVVDIPDANLRAAIETALGKASDATITMSDMVNLTDLQARNASIQDLTGLEHATNLASLNLGAEYVEAEDRSINSNLVSDLSPLTGLTQLTQLYLGGNNISDISALAGLTNLTQLGLGGNSIADILPLAELTNLTWLGLWDNRISDLSPLTGLTQLTQLYLGGNNISDLSPLVANTGLGKGDTIYVWENLLSPLSIHTHIPTLQSRGVDVGFDTVVVVDIPDPNLRAAIETILGKASDATITMSDMVNLTYFGPLSANISNLAGLEFATNLIELNLENNSISDLSPLVANPGLGAGDTIYIRRNPLSNLSITTHIPILQSRGVTVDFDDTTRLNVGTPRTVRLIYFLPNDRPYRSDVVQRMKDEIRTVQRFYAEQMGVHGYGEVTFRVETDSQGEPIVHRVDGQHPDSHYIENPFAFVDNEIARTFNLYAHIYLIVSDSATSHIGGECLLGYGSRLEKNAGWALITETFQWETAAHELGHAFGLEHDFRDSTYLMAYGSQKRLSACAAEMLSLHSYFNPDASIEKGPPPAIELISPRTYPTESRSISVQLKVNDSEGIHQVLLSSGSGLNTCRALEGEREALLEFKYDGGWGLEGFVNLSDSVVNLIYVRAVDTDGNMSREFFTLAEISPHHIATLSGHRGVVESIAFSPDGTILASGAQNGTMRLWEVGMQQSIATRNNVTSISMSFSPDGTILASPYELWNVATQQSIATLNDVGPVTSVSFSPDGTTLALGAPDQTIKLWDVETREIIATLRHGDWVQSVSYSSDGTILASGAWHGTIKLWNMATRQNIATLSGHRGVVESIAFSPDGTILASGSDDGTARLWDVTTKSNIAIFESGWGYDPISVSFSPDGATLASGSWFGRIIKLWDVATGANFAVFGHTNPIAAVSFSPDGTILASGTSEGTVELWDVSELTYLRLDAVAEIDIPDRNLRTAIMTTLGKPLDAPIARGNMATLTVFSAGEIGISNLTGLEHATNLKILHLWGNSILDLSPLAGLTKLIDLRLRQNSISDISSLAGLTKLDTLILWENSISDLSPLMDLTNLKTLHLWDNAISDLSPLVANTGLEEGDRVEVFGNPLSYQSIHTHIPILQERGVDVNFDIQAHPALLKISGNNQKGASFASLAHPFIVEAQDANGSALAGILVTFAVTAGGGTLSTTNTRTGPNGRAQSTLTLGPNLGTNTVQVSAAGIAVPAIFHAVSDAEAPSIAADVNNDGSVNVLDLVVVASELGNAGSNLAVDVNGDGAVNVLDLILVAGMFDGAAAAPTAQPQVPQTLTAVEVQGWLTEARTLDVRDHL